MSDISPEHMLDFVAERLLDAGISPGRCEGCGYIFVNSIDRYCVDDNGCVLCLAAMEDGTDEDCPTAALRSDPTE